MKIGIYKITNITNQRSYIGQSIDIDRRWKTHKSRSNWDTRYPIYRAFEKYGIDSFKFEVLELCERESLNDLESHYIELHDTFKSGYNATIGGDSFYSLEQYLRSEEVKKLLLTTGLSGIDIGEIVGLSDQTVSDINNGKIWVDKNLNYPIRRGKSPNFCRCGIKISWGAVSCVDCNSISSRIVERPSVEALEKELKSSNFRAVGRKYGVSDNAVRKWCDYYGISRSAKDYK